MKARPTPTAAYLQTKVLTANPAELRLMLFDGAIRFAQQAREGLATKKWESAFVGVTRCQEILMELINALQPQHDPSLCQKLSALYTFMYTQLMKASSNRDPQIVDEVLKLLHFERETWSMVLEQLAAENKAAAKATDLPSDIAPTVPAPATGVSNLVGATVSLRG